MPSTSTLDLNAIEAEIVREALCDELRDMAVASADDLQGDDPLDDINVIDARWKIERAAVCLDLLVRLGFIEERTQDRLGVAGVVHGERTAPVDRI